MIKIIWTMLIFTSAAFGACPSLDLENIPSSVNFQNDLTPQIKFRVTRSSKNDFCNFAIGIDKGGASNYNRQIKNLNNSMNYNLSTKSSHNSTMKDVNDATNPAEIITGEFEENKGPTKSNEKFYGKLTVPSNPFSGNYSDTVNVRLYELVSGSWVQRSSKPVIFFYNVPENVSLSIVERGGSFNSNSTSKSLNFGTLVTGSSQGLDVMIRTTSGYSLYVSSQNNGQLKRTQGNYFVNYIFKVDSTQKSLQGSSNNPMLASTGVGSHPGDGFRILFDFGIGAITNQPAGNYRDILTLTVTTNL